MRQKVAVEEEEGEGKGKSEEEDDKPMCRFGLLVKVQGKRPMK